MTTTQIDAEAQVCALFDAAAALQTDVSVCLTTSEDMVRVVSRLPAAVLFGCFHASGAGVYVYWTATATRGRARLSACCSRMATPREIRAVRHWESVPGQVGMRGSLRQWVEGATS